MSMDIQVGNAVGVTCNSNADLTLSGHPIRPGAAALTQKGTGLTGGGNLTLSNNNSSLLGSIDISGGNLIVTTSQALGSTVSGTTVEAGGTLQLNTTNATFNETLDLNGSGKSG